MPFNSLTFLLVFLPGALALHALVARLAPSGRGPLLIVLSFAFYGWWDLRFVPLLALSIALNWGLAEAYRRTRRGGLITLAIALDLFVLALFKYLVFLVDLADAIPGVALPPVSLALPLGISFFTFQHIAYLVDLRRGTAERLGLLDYALYVAFFPRVIAGPLVRPAQFREEMGAPALVGAEGAARALMLLTGGLAKKVFLGDPLGTFVDPVFAAAAGGGPVGLAQAVQGTLGYTLQLYFDFSGYTDMALGIALLFGIALPPNFDAPYRAVSIQDFWRRWHMTLSFFLRDYLYIVFGGSRHGLGLQLLALFATMALGGLWHGAGLTFVAWGAAHGLALGLHGLWRRAGLGLPALMGGLLTFAFVALTWVLFRAPDFAAAGAVYRGFLALGTAGAGWEAGFWGLALPGLALALLGPTTAGLAARLPTAPFVAVAASLAAAAVLLKIGDDANHAFIYARF